MTRYLVAFVALLALTAANVLVSTLNLGTRTAVTMAFLIAAVEAVVAAVVFMHLTAERRFVVATIAFTNLVLAGLLFWPAWDLYDRPRL